MTADLLQQIEAQGGIIDLSARARFRLTGSDRVRYLNGQVTNDVRKASRTETLYACVTDLKGRIVGDVFIHESEQGDALLLDAEPELREILGPRLERYIIADDVELTDITDEWQMWHLFGPAAQGFANGLKTNRLGIEGVDLWLPLTSPQLHLSTSPQLSPQDFETYRILRGIPRFPNELNAHTFPPEVGIESRAMSYTKGCYIGQEVLSRIRTTGKMPHELVRWRSDTPVEAGESVFQTDASGAYKALGKITSSAFHPAQNQHVGLALVKQGSAPLDSRLPVGADTPRIAAAIEITAVV